MAEPFLLFSAGHHDADFIHASGFAVEWGIYVSFGPGDDLVVTWNTEMSRARLESTARTVRENTEFGWREGQDRIGDLAAWARAAANALAERGVREIRISPHLRTGFYLALTDAGIELVVDDRLLVAERRRKSPAAVEAIAAAQRAAESACRAVARLLARAEPRDGLVWLDGRVLTSERARSEAISHLNELGYPFLPYQILAGAPFSAIPHHPGAGELRAGLPIILDLAPAGPDQYHGDLSRTFVVGEVPEKVRSMHEASVQAFKASLAAVRAGASGRLVHEATCRALVAAGYGTVWEGFEGRRDGPLLVHATGHGLGLSVHEEPNLRSVDQELWEGDVITIEPGLYEEGYGGVRVENAVLVTADGGRDLDSLPMSLDPREYG